MGGRVSSHPPSEPRFLSTAPRQACHYRGAALDPPVTSCPHPTFPLSPSIGTSGFQQSRTLNGTHSVLPLLDFTDWAELLVTHYWLIFLIKHRNHFQVLSTSKIWSERSPGPRGLQQGWDT